jgi:hypothetical protein
MTMPQNPAELPEGEGGGGRSDLTRIRGGIGGPQELPPPDYWGRVSISQLVSELFRLRDRVHYLESGQLAAKMRAIGGAVAFGGVIGGPNELPEGEGGGGGRVPFPGEIHEIAELPPFSRLVTEFSSLIARFNQFERQITQQLGAITKSLETMKK